MRMKLLVATSVIALSAATAAQAGTSGSVTAGISYGQETDGMHSHFYIKNLNAQLNFALDERWSTQVVVFGAAAGAQQNSWYGKNDDSIGLTTYGAAAHFNTDVHDDLKIGAFGMLEETTVGDFGYSTSGGNLYMAVGGEARWMASSAFSITGQVGGLFHLDAPYDRDTCEALCNAVFVNVGATWFFDPNNSVSAGAGYLSGSGGSDDIGFVVGQTGWNYGVNVRHQFEDSPYAVGLGYNGMSFTWGGYTQTDNVVSANVTFFFGGSSLERQHNAGGFMTPTFNRQINLSASLDDVDYP